MTIKSRCLRLGMGGCRIKPWDGTIDEGGRWRGPYAIITDFCLLLCFEMHRVATVLLRRLAGRRKSVPAWLCFAVL
jgi:hypothetical protein